MWSYFYDTHNLSPPTHHTHVPTRNKPVPTNHPTQACLRAALSAVRFLNHCLSLLPKSFDRHEGCKFGSSPPTTRGRARRDQDQRNREWRRVIFNCRSTQMEPQRQRRTRSRGANEGMTNPVNGAASCPSSPSVKRCVRNGCLDREKGKDRNGMLWRRGEGVNNLRRKDAPCNKTSAKRKF